MIDRRTTSKQFEQRLMDAEQQHSWSSHWHQLMYHLILFWSNSYMYSLLGAMLQQKMSSEVCQDKYFIIMSCTEACNPQSEPIKSNYILIAPTSANIENWGDKVKQSPVRQSLIYLLSTFSVQLPHKDNVCHQRTFTIFEEYLQFPHQIMVGLDQD